jgi:branched-chain amino acid transport system ATP-binding protein
VIQDRDREILPPALEVTNLHSYIGVSHVLQGITFTASRHEVTAIVGRNGAGKTTTMRAVMGLVDREGSVVLDGNPIDEAPVHVIANLGVGYVPEDRDVFHGLTVQENLRLAERRNGTLHYDRVFELFPELEQRRSQPAGTLSGGQQQMLSLGRGLLNDNSVLLIDEPTKGLAPRVVTEVVEVLERAREVCTVIMVEQNLSVARRLADHVVAVAEGCVVLEGPATEVFHEDERMRDILGVARDGQDRTR